jgi:RHS repeat-associated protein
MSLRVLALGGMLAALVPIAGSAPARGINALAPWDVLVDGLEDPRGLATDSDDVVFVADRGRGTLLRVAPDGTRRVVARGLDRPFGVAVDGEAQVLVSEEGRGRVLRVAGPTPSVVVAGLARPRWLALGDDGTLYVVVRDSGREGDGDDDGPDAIVAVAPDGRQSTFVDGLREVGGLVANGTGVYVVARARAAALAVRRYPVLRDGGTDAGVPILRPNGAAGVGGLARDGLGAFWVSAREADTRGGRVRDGVLKLHEHDSTAFAGGLDEPRALAFGPEGHLYVADVRTGRVLRFRAPVAPSVVRPPAAVPSTALALRGTATPNARVDVFVNDADVPVSGQAGADGAFTSRLVLAPSSESRVHVFATAVHGDGLSSAPVSFSIVHDGDEPDLAFLQPRAGAFVRGQVDVDVRAGDRGTAVEQLSVGVGGRALERTLSSPLPARDVVASARWTTDDLPDGTVTLTAQAADTAGNTRGASRVVVVDNTPPAVEILEGPPDDTAASTVVFRVGGSDNLTPAAALTFAWRLDGGAYTAFDAATSITPAPLAPGAHVFEALARDLAGNESTAPAARRFSVSVAPTITAVVPAHAPVGAVVTIAGAAFGPGPVVVSFNGARAAIRALSSTSIVTTVPPGATTGTLAVVSDRGTATHAFAVDGVAALALAVRPAALRTVAGLPVTATLTLQAPDDASFSDLATLTVRDVPDGLTARLGAIALTGGASTTLTLTPTGETAIAGAIVVEASAMVGGVPVRLATSVAVDVLAGQHTALGGRLALVDDTPIAGARLSLNGVVSLSDAGGNFLFVDAPAGRQTLGVDANAATAGWPIYAIDVELVGGRATRLPPLRITPPPPPERFVALDNAARDQQVTDERFPGFALTLPAGVTIAGWDGTLKQRVAVARLTASALPVPAPPFPARSFYQIFFGTPMGGLPSAPLPVTLPNDQDAAPGETVEIWYYDAAPIPGATAGWRLAGDAVVSADGTRAVSKPGVGLARFCGVCGIACIKRTVAGQPNVALRGIRGGDPVDLGTGLLILEKTDLALAARIPAFVHRVYNAVDPFGRVAGFELATGPGWMLSVDVALLEDGASARVLVMPGNARFTLSRDDDGTFRNSTSPPLAGAVLHAEADGSHRLVFKDGAWWRFRSGVQVRGRGVVLTGLGLLVEQGDRHGNRLTIDRDDYGAVASIIEPAGRTLGFTTALLDPTDPTSARLVAVADPLGRHVRYGYDAQRRLTSVTDAAGGVVRYAYDAGSRIVSITDPRGITYLTNEYDADGRVRRQVQADGGVWTFAYEGTPLAHTRVTVIDPRGAATTHDFDGGRPVATIDALGQPTYQRRDASGRVVELRDGHGRRVGVDYDAGGNAVRLTDPLGGVRTVAYDGDRPVALVDALGGVSRLEYDAAGRLAAAVGADGARVTFEVDDLGQPIAVTDAAGLTTRLEYARTGDVVAVVDSLGRRTTLEYDAVSRLIRRRDPAGGVVSIAYDALDRVIQLADASGVVTQAHDANGNVVSVTDPLGRATRYEYDAMDRRVAKTDSLGATERYEYDGLGNLTRFVDRTGQASSYEYDALGRRVSEREADGRRQDFTYDVAGRLVRAATDGEAVLFAYDALDRLVAETTVLGTTRYTWDAGGRRVTLTRPTGALVTYAYDAASRLTRVSDGASTVELQYDTAGRRRRLRLPGGIDADYAYDAAWRLTQLTYRRGDDTVATLAYTHDDLGRRVEAAGSLAPTALPEAVDSAIYDAANRPQRFGAWSLSFDSNGNLTTLTGPDGTRVYRWDAGGRLVAVATAADSVSFTYDALGRRIRRDASARTTTFGYDGGDVVEDVADDGTLAYLRGASPDELFTVGAASVLVDGAGSLMRLVDVESTPAAAAAYEPFGRASGPSVSRYGFTGREREEDDLYYYRARYYHARLGRFISEDPLGLLAGVNGYVYALNDPVNQVDPTGLRTYVLHGVWPDRAAFDDFAASLRTADPTARALSWNGQLVGGVLPSTSGVAAPLMQQILADLDAQPLAATEKLNLVGFSAGGLVAATLAQMLSARGVKVDTVVSMGTLAQTPLTTRVPAQTRLLNFIGVADPLVSFRLHPRGTNYLVLATHAARSYTENAAVLALIRRELTR